MRILVTGASGQVGSATAQRLASRATVIATDRAILDLAKPDAIPAILSKDRTRARHQCCRLYRGRSELRRSRPWPSVVNADAPRRHGAMVRGPRRPLDPFLYGLCVRRSAAPGLGRRLDTPRPLSAYGASKLAGEERIRAAGGSFLIIRTSWVYAAHGTNFLRKIALLAKTNAELRIVADQIGAPTSAALIADAVVEDRRGRTSRVSTTRRARRRGLVHLAASGEASWYEFADEIVDGLQSRGVPLAVERIVPIRTDDYPLPAQRPLNSRLNLAALPRPCSG